MRGIEFKRVAQRSKSGPRYEIERVLPAPPYTQERDQIFGRYDHGNFLGRVCVAIMWDYYSVSAEEQRRMVENTIALCEMKYAEQEVNNV